MGCQKPFKINGGLMGDDDTQTPQGLKILSPCTLKTPG